MSEISLRSLTKSLVVLCTIQLSRQLHTRSDPHTNILSSTETIPLTALPGKILKLLPDIHPPGKNLPFQILWKLKSETFKPPARELDLLITDYPDWTYCCADGFNCENTCGAAFVSSFLPTISSVTTAEMMVIYQCLYYLLIPTRSQYVIFTDSEISLRKIGHPNTDCPLTSYSKYVLHHLLAADVELTFL